MIPTIEKRNLSDQVFEQIKRMILSYTFKGGERIPEAKLSEMFGISRTPLRDALKKLNDIGLVVLKPRSYAEVVEIHKEQARQIAEVRLNLEILSAGLFSKNGKAAQYDELIRITDHSLEINKTESRAEAYIEDSLFHIKIAEFSGNSCLLEMLEKLDPRVQLVRLNQRLSREVLAEYISQHYKLIEAMREKNNKLIESILREHIFHNFHD